MWIQDAKPLTEKEHAFLAHYLSVPISTTILGTEGASKKRQKESLEIFARTGQRQRPHTTEGKTRSLKKKERQQRPRTFHGKEFRQRPRTSHGKEARQRHRPKSSSKYKRQSKGCRAAGKPEWSLRPRTAPDPSEAFMPPTSETKSPYLASPYSMTIRESIRPSPIVNTRRARLVSLGFPVASTSSACPECHEEVPEGKMAKHLKHSCPKRIIACSKCGTLTSAHKMKAHVRSKDCALIRRRQQILNKAERAIHETWECPDCHKHVLVKDKTVHQYFDCPERMVRCQLCKEWINGGAKSMLDHLDEFNLVNPCVVVKRKRRQRIMAERAMERRLTKEMAKFKCSNKKSNRKDAPKKSGRVK